MNEQGIEESQKAGGGDWVKSKKLSIDTRSTPFKSVLSNISVGLLII